MIPFASNLNTIPDLKAAMQAGLPLFRRQIGPAAVSFSPLPLIAGTERFTDRWLREWFVSPADRKARDVACYYATDAIISGDGQIWLLDSLITSEEIMPPYVLEGLGISQGGNDQLHSTARLPIRTIEGPCLVATGHGIKVYGHFVIELLFRILIGREAFFQVDHPPYRILLDFAAPSWLLRILEENFGLGPASIEFFFPQQERVLLRHAIIPTSIFQDSGINPFANYLIDNLMQRLEIQAQPRQYPRIFVARGNYHNPASPFRICKNEQELINIAIKRHGFKSVKVETMSWRQQIALFWNAEIVIGQGGSGLHTALFSKPGSRLASIGNLNFVQAEIGALRRQHTAFYTENIELKGHFSVDENLFQAFIDRVCDLPYDVSAAGSTASRT